MYHAGAHIILHGRDQEQLARTAADIADSAAPPDLPTAASDLRRATPPTIAYVTGDLTDPAAVRDLMSDVQQTIPKIDILVCNAGVSMRGAFSDCTPELLTQVVSGNLLATMYLITTALPYINPNGSIILISSGAGLYGFPGVIPYSAAKMALSALQQGLAVELADRHIHVGKVFLTFIKNDPDKSIFDAHGNLQNISRPARYTQQMAARIVLRTISRRRATACLGRDIRLVNFALRYAPRLFGFFVRRSHGRLHSARPQQ